MLIRTNWFSSPVFITNWDNYSSHNFNIKKNILDIKNSTKPKNKSNVNGWQSDRNLHEHTFIKHLFEFICISASQTLLDMKVDLSKYKVCITDMWANVNTPGSYNKSHQHNNSFISGVYYLKVPNNSGNIFFEDTRNLWCLLQASYTENDTFNSMEVEYKPIEGMLILFPSYLSHRVDINNSDEDRISVSFNVNLVK